MGILSKLIVPAPVQAGWGVAKRVIGAIPPQVWMMLALVTAVWGYGHWRYTAGEIAVQTKFDAHLSADRGAQAVAKQRAQLREEQDRAAFAVIGATFDQEQTHAIEKGNAVAAGVRAGTLVLRDHWQGCPAALPGAPAGAEADHAAAELRAKDSGDLVQIGAEADNAVRSCQAVLSAERAKPIAP